MKKSKVIMIKITALLALVVILKVASEIDKQVLLIECVDNTTGTDTECARCYEEIYGEKPE